MNIVSKVQKVNGYCTNLVIIISILMDEYYHRLSVINDYYLFTALAS